jgi:dynein heavy chain
VVTKESAGDAAKTAKEARAAAAARLDGRHRYVIGRVADLLGMGAQDAEDQILDGGATQLDRLDQFFEANGPRHSAFFYQPVLFKGKSERRVTVADPAKDKLTGTCVFAVRITPRAITTSNMANEINFGAFHGSDDGHSLLADLRDMIADVLGPALHVRDPLALRSPPALALTLYWGLFSSQPCPPCSLRVNPTPPVTSQLRPHPCCLDLPAGERELGQAAPGRRATRGVF